MTDAPQSVRRPLLLCTVFGVPVYRWLALAGVGAVLVLLSLFIRDRLDIKWSLESLRAFVLGLGFWGPLAYMGILTFRFLFLIPTGLLLLAGGILFGPLYGTLYAGLGIFGSGILKYGFVAIIGQDKILTRLPLRLQAWMQTLAQGRMSAWALFGVCAYPFFPKHVFQYAAILSGMGLSSYIVAVLAGGFVQAFLFAILGDAIYSGAGIALSASLLIAGVILPLAVPSWRRWMLAPLTSKSAKETPA